MMFVIGTTLFQSTSDNWFISISSQIVDEEILDLLERMLTITPSKRPSAKEVMQHSFFQTKRDSDSHNNNQMVSLDLS